MAINIYVVGIVYDYRTITNLLNHIDMNNNSEKIVKVVNRYQRVKNYIKNSMNDSDLNTYVQQLIQADRLKTQLVTEIISSAK